MLKKILAGVGAIALATAGLMTTTANAESVPHSPEANQASFWEDYFKDVDGVSCKKVGTKDTPFTVGQPSDGHEWVAVIVKAGAGDGANDVHRDVKPGDKISHESGKRTSHVIVCEAPIVEETPEPSDEPTPEPSDQPTPEPSEKPTPEPSDEPTPEPSEKPSEPGDDCTPKEPCPTPTKDDCEPKKPCEDEPGKPAPSKPGMPSTGV